jgi:hypothetical protein
MERARAYADEAGVRLTPAVLSEVHATLQAALVDLAGALTVRNGRLVRPLSHSGFGPRPRVSVAQIGSGAELQPVEVPIRPAAEIERPEVEDELAARRRTVLRAVELVEVTDRALGANEDVQPAPGNETKALRELRQAEEELAAVEAAHWTTEFELADAEAAVEAAEEALSELDSRRMEARRDKVTAQRHLSEARSRQRHAVNALAEARRRLESARVAADGDE